MTMTSAGVHASARAAARPPKPAPTMTTLGRRGGACEGVAAASIGGLLEVPASSGDVVDERRHARIDDQPPQQGQDLVPADHQDGGAEHQVGAGFLEQGPTVVIGIYT